MFSICGVMLAPEPQADLGLASSVLLTKLSNLATPHWHGCTNEDDWLLLLTPCVSLPLGHQAFLL